MVCFCVICKDDEIHEITDISVVLYLENLDTSTHLWYICPLPIKMLYFNPTLGQNGQTQPIGL